MVSWKLSVLKSFILYNNNNSYIVIINFWARLICGRRLRSPNFDTFSWRSQRHLINEGQVMKSLMCRLVSAAIIFRALGNVCKVLQVTSRHALWLIHLLLLSTWLLFYVGSRWTQGCETKSVMEQGEGKREGQ